MAIVETVPSQVEVGEVFSISGTGYTHSGNINVKAYSQDGDGGLAIDSVTLKADGSGILADGLLQLIAQMEGHVVIEITDVTAVATHDHTVEVFKSEGV